MPHLEAKHSLACVQVHSGAFKCIQVPNSSCHALLQCAVGQAETLEERCRLLQVIVLAKHCYKPAGKGHTLADRLRYNKPVATLIIVEKHPAHSLCIVDLAIMIAVVLLYQTLGVFAS